MVLWQKEDNKVIFKKKNTWKFADNSKVLLTPETSETDYDLPEASDCVTLFVSGAEFE